jgi:anti-sigma-K factor RskA
MTDEPRDEADPAVLQGLAQVVPQIDPPAELRARVLGQIQGQASFSTRSREKDSRPLFWLAASLTLAVGLGAYALHLRGRIATFETDLRDARRAASGAQSAVAVLTAPDVTRVDLAGQPAAPTAAARAFWSRSRGLVFTGTNLPQLPPGRTYQLWVVTAQAPISAGLLTPDSQGGVSGTFATPVDIPAPVAMAVTIEPAGGVPAPTGDKYLVGAL